MNRKEYKDIDEKMKKVIGGLKEALAGLRAGRANPALLDKLHIDYYGVPTPVNQIGNISVPEARIILIQPWDVKTLKDIEKAIQKSDIGINPNNDGKVIRLVFPPLTEERRKELVKVVKRDGEEAKVSVRNVRRDVIEHYKAQKKASTITEDDLKQAEKDVQEITDEYIKEIDKVMELKEKEIMEV